MIKCPNCGCDNLDGSAYCDSCGDPLTTAPAHSTGPEAASAGSRVIAGRYRIERELGGGGQKQMYLAADLRLSQRLCALAELTPSARTQAAVAEGMAMFQREAEILATLSNIHIVQVYDYFVESDRCYLVEEYVRGRSLQDRIAGPGRLAVAETVPIVLQVLDALEYIHSLTPPLVHRDLKPDNIMLAPATGGAEVVKLIDFGIARHFEPRRGTVHGTPGYAAPEQYKGLSDPRTDLYALGAILHYAFSGRDPQDEPPFSFPPLASLRPDLPAALCELVDQALSIEPAQRVPTAAGFKLRLLVATSADQHSAQSLRPTARIPRAPTVPPTSQAPTAALPPEAPAPSSIQWSPAQVIFRAVTRGAPVEPATLTVHNTGRGTLEARVGTDNPGLVHVTPDRIEQNQAHLRVGIDSAAVMWGHRYRARILLTLDHSQATVAIPVLVEAADNQSVLARVRSLSTAATVIVPTLALAVEIVLAGAGISISGSLHGAAFAAAREAAGAIAFVAMIAVLIALVATARRSRALLFIVGLLAILALQKAAGTFLLDYLMLPALLAGVTKAGSLAVRRLCIRMLAREGMGLWAQTKALSILIAAPSAVLLGTTGWLLPAAVAPLTTTAVPPVASVPSVSYPPPSAAPTMRVQPSPPAQYRATARPRRTPRAPEVIAAEIRRRLAANGFDHVTVQTLGGGRVYMRGEVSGVSQKEAIENIARGVAGVRGVVLDIGVPRGWMGVTVRSGGGGAVVTYLMPGGPADRAGVARGDVIFAMDGVRIRNHPDFDRAIATKLAGQTVTIQFRRGAQTMSVAVRLRKSPFRHG